MQRRNLDIRIQTFISSVGIGIQYFAQWLISVLLVRMDGYEAAGIFSLAMTISNVFAYFSGYGLRNYQITDAQWSYSDRQYILARIQTSLIGSVLCIGYLVLAPGYTRLEMSAIFVYLVYQNVIGIGDIMLGAIQIRNHLEINGFSFMIRGAVCFIAFVAVYFFEKNILLALLMMTLAAAATTLFYDYREYRNYVPRGKGPLLQDVVKARRLWKDCFFLMISQIIPLITTAVPRRTIQGMLGTDTLGIFSSIFTPTVIISTMTPAIVTAFLPRIAVQWKRGNAAWVRGAMWMGVGLFSAGTVAALGVVRLCGRPIMALLFGADILNYFSLLYWAVLATVCITVASFLNGILTAIRRTNCIAFLTTGSMLLTVCLASFMIIQFGIYGAAYLQILVYLIQVILQILLISFFTGVSVESGKKELP